MCILYLFALMDLPPLFPFLFQFLALVTDSASNNGMMVSEFACKNALPSLKHGQVGRRAG